MDMQKPIKFEGQYFGIETDSDFNGCFNNQFIHQIIAKCEDLSGQNHEYDLEEQMVERIKRNADIRVTSIGDLVEYAKLDANWNQINQLKLRRSLWKTKLIQKRERAKNRRKNKGEKIILQKSSYEVVSMDRLEDIKKQKNRLSAQISRDRKKQHYSRLEKENEQLRQSIESLRKVNSDLQCRFNANRESETSKKKSENIFKTLLVFLGIIFLLNLIRGNQEIRKEKDSQKHGITKIELSKAQKMFISTQMKAIGVQIPSLFLEKCKVEQNCNKNLLSRISEIRSSLL